VVKLFFNNLMAGYLRKIVEKSTKKIADADRELRNLR